MKNWAKRARRLKVELFALYLAARHPQRPLAIALAVRFVPAPVLAECRGRARERVAMRGRSSWIPIAAVWLAMAAAGVAFYL
jgi:hypothetical protein